MKQLLTLALTLALAASCQSVAPVIVSAQVSGAGAPVAVARTNLRQTFIMGSANFTGEIMTADGIPIFVHNVSEGTQLYIDRDEGVRIEGPIGTPLPAAAKVLFPRPGEAAALGVAFEDE